MKRALVTGAAGTSRLASVVVVVAAAMLVSGARPSAASTAACPAPSHDAVPLVWGNNDFGEAGTWPNSISRLPRVIPGIANARSIKLGWQSVYVLRSDQSVVAWGRGDHGELGNGKLIDETAPVAVSGLGPGSGVVQLDSYFETAYAREADGSVLAWGADDYDQLGDGGGANRDSPVEVHGLGTGSAVVDIAAGETFAAALRSDGSAVWWGTWGPLGTASIPTAIPGIGPGSGVVDIEAAADHLLAVKGNGSVLYLGELGGPPDHPPTETTATPVPLPAASTVVRVAPGDLDDLLELSNGSVLFWGYDGSNPNQPYAPTPEPLPGLGPGSGVVAIAVGGNHNLALRSDGTVLAWGLSGYGQLGNPATYYTGQSTPGVVVGLGPGSGANSIDASVNGSAATRLGAPPPAITSVSPTRGPVTGGTAVTVTGVGLACVTAVRFGIEPAVFSHVSDTELDASAPRQPTTRLVNIVVAAATGTSGSSINTWFTYTAT